MKIAVCIKQILDPGFPFALDQEKFVPVEDDIFYRTNPADLCAAALAAQLEQRFGAEVSFLTLGPQRTELSLRECLAIGGSRAVRVWDDSLQPDANLKPYLLARAAARLGADLVLCGSRSADEGSGQTPPALAEYLGIPQVIAVTDVDFSTNDRTLTAQRKLERGRRETIECPLPALLALEPGSVPAVYAALPRWLESRRQTIEVLDRQALDLDPAVMERLGSLASSVRRSPPRPRPKKTFNLDTSLTAEQRMEAMMSGGLKQSRSDLIEGTPGELAGKLVSLFKEKVPTS